MEEPRKQRNTGKRASLAPLTFDEALEALRKTPREDKNREQSYHGKVRETGPPPNQAPGGA